MCNILGSSGNISCKSENILPIEDRMKTPSRSMRLRRRDAFHGKYMQILISSLMVGASEKGSKNILKPPLRPTLITIYLTWF